MIVGGTMKHMIVMYLCLSLMILSGCSGEKESATEKKKTKTVQTKPQGPSDAEKAVVKSVRKILKEQRKEIGSLKVCYSGL